mmetsp:Transcript_60348/g.161578  ORF Transcript_60348/g.161578 Transcript_60348/m.161578 type:complete len:127 (-) Transcript_60348:172-552(-)
MMAKLLLLVLAAVAAPAVMASSADEDSWEPSELDEQQSWSDPPADEDMSVLELGSRLSGRPEGDDGQAGVANSQVEVGQAQPVPGSKGGVVDVRLSSELQEGKGKVRAPAPSFMQKRPRGESMDEA